MTFDEEIVVFHFRLGATITQWASVEGALAGIFLSGFPDRNLVRASLALGIFSLESFRGKLDFVDVAVSTRLEAVTKVEWAKLIAKARTLSTSRNKLAHWYIGKYSHCKEGKRVVLSPPINKTPITDRNKIGFPPDGSLRIMDITKMGLEFANLAYDLSVFHAHVYELEAPHPRSPEQLKGPPTVQMQARQIREVFSAQHRPSKKKR